MFFLKNTPIDQILSLSEMIEAIEDTLKEIAAGPVSVTVKEERQTQFALWTRFETIQEPQT